MSYKVLYRKYRPDSFNKIVGQKAIVDNLRSSVEENSFSHAYIFTGPRGTGKTSTAKVLAKALTCINPVHGEACGECENCKNFATSPDIIEIDAASNNGVNEIRELRNNITLAPSASKYKIYIVDEVHMLTTGAFNALLKTLEEPPAHAIFILATTEVYKVPITILSRCQRYDFKKIDKKEMLSHLNDICRKENIACEDGALEEIYELSEGCLRDALSILDQTSKSQKKLTIDDLLKNYNMISNSAVKELLMAIKQSKVGEIIDKIESYENSGINAQKLIKRMINYLEKIAIEIKLGKNKDFSYRTIADLIDNLNRCYVDARINENVFTIIKLCFLEAIPNSIEMVEKVQKEPPKPEEQNTKKETYSNSHEMTTSEERATQNMTLTEIRINNCFVAASKKDLNDLIEKWNQLETKKSLGVDVNDYRPVAASENYAIFTAEEDSLANLFNMKYVDIEKALKKAKLEMKVVALTNKAWLEEREKYKANLKKNMKYEYIEEPKMEEPPSELKKEAEDLFTERLVEIS